MRIGHLGSTRRTREIEMELERASELGWLLLESVGR